MSSLSADTRRWLDEMAEQRRAVQERERKEFFSSGRSIPDLDMMPDCSICGGGLEYDEGFFCGGCNVQWGTRGDDGEALCPSCGDPLHGTCEVS